MTAMTASTILLKTPIIFQLPVAGNDAPAFLGNCVLTWERDSLFVTPQSVEEKRGMSALRNRVWLQECLMRSPIRKIYLDATMTESVLKAWADMGETTRKQVYLKVPDLPNLPQVRRPKSWLVKRLADWLVAALLLGFLSPVMGLLAVLIRLDSQGPVLFRQWRVGAGGRLFRIYKFRSMVADAETQHQAVMGNQTGLHKLEYDPRVTRIGRWLRKLSLDELPQLWNVLRGEMSLVGPRPWALYDAVRIEAELQGRLRALPGMTGAWQVEGRSNVLDLNIITCSDLAYLKQWELRKDSKILLLTVPNVLFGIGAC